MKLLRLTSEKTTGEFDCYLNQEIDLPPKSQIALQSCVFQATDTALIIDSNNNKIEFKTSDSSGTQEIDLYASGSTIYDSTNTQVLFDDIQNKINCRMLMSNNDQIGKQFRIKTGDSGKIEAEFKTLFYTSQNSDLAENVNTTTVGGIADSKTLEITVDRQIGSLSPIDNKAGDTLYNFFTHYTYPICSGIGVFRVQLSKLQTEGILSGGFTVGLSSIAPGDAKDGSFSETSFISAVQVLNDSKTVYSTSVNGTAFLDSTHNVFKPTPQQSDLNLGDYIEISVQNDENGTDKYIVTTIYSWDLVNNSLQFIPTVLTAIKWVDSSTNPTDLYAYIFMHGGFLNGAYNCRLAYPKFTADPFKVPEDHISHTTSLESFPHTETMPLQPTRRSSRHSINFISESLYSWLGYNYGKREAIIFSNPVFAGDYSFGSKIVADSFLIQLLNLGVDSYDTLPEKQGRENILAVIPKTDTNIRVIYEANGLYFLDINNANPIKLSNIKLRIVRQDYSQVNTSNISSVVCFIK